MRIFDDQFIVVTGGAGFLGSAVIRQLNERGLSNIVVVDTLRNDERWKNLVGKNFAEIVSIEDLFKSLNGRENVIEAFIHLGANSNTLETDAEHLLENNYRFSVKLAIYAIRNNHRFIYASSAATYGDGSRGFSDNHDTLETLRPLNMYGYSKHLFDLWLKNRGLLSKVVGLKYFNVYGPNEYHKGRMASAITRMLPQALNGGISLFKSNDPDKYPDGGQKRDFIYVKDAARMTCAFLDNDIGGIYNIGTGKSTTWNDLAKAVFKAVQKTPQIHYVEMPADITGYQNFTYIIFKSQRSFERKSCMSYAG